MWKKGHAPLHHLNFTLEIKRHVYIPPSHTGDCVEVYARSHVSDRSNKGGGEKGEKSGKEHL